MFHRQIEVGRVERRTLSPDARQVQFDIFVEAPFHAHVYPDTRFYGVSGVEASIDADGAAVRVESIAALFTGGIAFDNPDVVEPESRVTEDGSRYRLHDSRRAARESLFDDAEDVRHRFTAAFEGSVKGLRVDAPIEYNGLRVGRVASVTTGLPEAPGEPGRSVVVLQLQPRRLGLPDVGVDELGARLGEFVAAGLRVQLATGNLLTGSMIIKLVDVPDAPPATIDAEAKPYPALPVVPSNVEAVTADVEELIRNLSELPLQALVASATELLQDAGKLVASPDVAGLPAQLADSLGSIATAASRVETATADLPAMLSALTSASRNADDVLAGLSPDSEIYIELAAAARELRIAARSIAAFAELLEENPNAVITGPLSAAEPSAVCSRCSRSAPAAAGPPRVSTCSSPVLADAGLLPPDTLDAIGIAVVSLPGYARDARMASREAGNRIVVDDAHRWAEDPDEAITRALAERAARARRGRRC